MARILRGDVVWANLNPAMGNEITGFRPVLAISQNVFNERSGTVIAIALTSQPQKAGFPLTLELESKRLPKKFRPACRNSEKSFAREFLSEQRRLRNG